MTRLPTDRVQPGVRERLEQSLWDSRVLPLKPDIRAILESHADLVEALQDCLAEHGGFTIKGRCEQRARAALAKAGVGQ